MYKLIRESTRFNLQVPLILVAAIGIVPLALGEKFKLEVNVKMIYVMMLICFKVLIRIFNYKIKHLLDLLIKRADI